MIALFYSTEQDLACNLPIPWVTLKVVCQVWKNLCLIAMAPTVYFTSNFTRCKTLVLIAYM